MGDVILTFHEESRTATYYLLEKNIALHFIRVPRDEDIFCFLPKDNIIIVDIDPLQEQEEHDTLSLRSYGSPWDADVYRVLQSNDGFELVMVTNCPRGITAKDEIQQAL